MIPFGDGSRTRVFPIVVYALIAANVWAFAQEMQAPDFNRFLDAYAEIPYDITHWVVLAPPSPPVPVLTLVTAMFLHGGILHIAFNMLFLFVFGPQVEALCGHLRFLILYLLCGIAGGIAMLVVGPNSHVPTIGASGAIAGILGAYLVNFPFAKIDTVVPIGCFPLFLRLPALLVIGLWALTQFLTGFDALSARAAESQGGVAYFAHIGGFCAGVLLIAPFKRRTKSRAW